jgi:hypothetical protein
MLRFVISLVIWFPLGSSVVLSADHSKLDEILKNCVAEERVDYARIKSQYLPQLNQYLEMTAEANPSAAGRDEQLAFYINVYNATMIKAVIDRDHAKFRPSDNDFAVFKEKLVKLREGEFSLNELENDIIRKRFNDPRIHAALVCAAVSCPPILARAYSERDLDQTLDDNVRRWLADPTRNQIDRANRKLKLSKIFDWYAEDFGGKEKVAAWVAGHLGDPSLSKWAVDYLEYDWTLNRK